MIKIRQPIRLFAVGAGSTSGSFPSPPAASKTPPVSSANSAVFTYSDTLNANNLAGRIRPSEVPEFVQVWPFGVSANDDAFAIRTYGWTRVGAGQQPNEIWIPAVISEFTCTMSSFGGLAGAPVINTELFCDLVVAVAARLLDRVIGAGTAVNSDYYAVTPSGDIPAMFMIPTFGFELLQFDFHQVTNTPTMNALVRGYDRDMT